MEHVVGIDVAKDRLDVHLRPSGESFAVARDGEGLVQLVDRLHPDVRRNGAGMLRSLTRRSGSGTPMPRPRLRSNALTELGPGL